MKKRHHERTLSLIVIALLLAIAAAAYFCATIPSMKFWTYKATTIEDTAAGDLDGMAFKLTSYSGMAIPAEQTYTLSFANGMMSAKFCNNLSGNYTYGNGMLSSGAVAATRMHCATPQNIMTFEAAFSTLFAGNGATATLEGSTLTLHKADTTMVFEQQ